MKLSVSKYNELNPKHIDELFKNGARLIKGQNYGVGVVIPIGRCFPKFIDGVSPEERDKIRANGCYVYSDDSICINNVTLPLAKAERDYFDCFVDINI